MYPAFEITVSAKFIESIRMLADWQIREMGIEPESALIATQQLDDHKEARAKEAREMTEAERAFDRQCPQRKIPTLPGCV